MASVLLLGSTGFIGSSIGNELDKQGIEWVGVARNIRGGDKPTIALTDAPSVTKVLRSKPIIINALGGLKPRNFNENFTAAMNEFWASLERFIRYLQNHPPAGLLHISSAGTVYGEAAERPSCETDPVRPRSWYGRMKVMEESMYRSYAQDYNVPFACARVSNPYGNPTASNHGLIDVLITQLSKNEPFVAAFPQKAMRDFIYAPCMAKILVRMALEGHTGIYNVGNGTPTSLQWIIDYAQELKPSAVVVERTASPSDIVNSSISTEKLEAALGKPEWAMTIERYMQKRLG
ncbi:MULTISPECIES: NAD-dependent epimerase/dehydratase family protein [Halomonadaceae]|uniref:NAD-dependent epimerase/dehydratase family protein n=1 Tax=Vreelandella sp. SM1641 TaxID=3126101 RepID=A0AAU7XTY7_9GAMM|nr:NAD-dependent epimerase/dehydratase family protein [Halomonas sp. KO116]AJY51412.1 NAD-dependent epimerase/dehydratase [Halomonas sp. KO116]